MAKGVTPRHKTRPTSGLVEAKLSLVKDPSTQRYCIYSLRCGDDHPHIVSSLEMDLQTGQLYFNGQIEGARKLVDVIHRRVLSGPNDEGLILEVSTNLLNELPADVPIDAEFNPHIYLTPWDELEVCARDEDELELFLRMTLGLASSGKLAYPDPECWKTWNIPAHTDHDFVLIYNPQMVERVLLKIGYAAASAWSRRGRHQFTPIARVQEAVLGKSDLSIFEIKDLQEDKSLSNEWEEYLLVVLSTVRNRVRSLICLYGFWYALDLASMEEMPQLSTPIGASCHVPTRSQRWLAASEIEEHFGPHIKNSSQPEGEGPQG